MRNHAVRTMLVARRVPHVPMAARDDLQQAEAALVAAWHRLLSLRREALLGRYDDVDAVEQALRDYRATVVALQRAKQQARQPARRGQLLRANRTPSPTPAPMMAPEEAPAGPLQMTPRLRFARWLYQTGRLSEDEPEAEPPGAE